MDRRELKQRISNEFHVALENQYPYRFENIDGSLKAAFPVLDLAPRRSLWKKVTLLAVTVAVVGLVSASIYSILNNTRASYDFVSSESSTPESKSDESSSNEKSEESATDFEAL